MRIGLYGRSTDPVLGALATGVRAWGGTPEFRRDIVFTADQVHPFDAVVVRAGPGPGDAIAAAYRARGVPILELDAGSAALGRVTLTRDSPDPALTHWTLDELATAAPLRALLEGEALLSGPAETSPDPLPFSPPPPAASDRLAVPPAAPAPPRRGRRKVQR